MIELDDIEYNEEDNLKAQIQAKTDEIHRLYAKVQHHPRVRLAGLSGLLGFLSVGPAGLIAAPIAWWLTKNVSNDPVSQQVALNQIKVKQKELQNLVSQAQRSDPQCVDELGLDGIMNSADLMDYEYDSYDFDGKWEALIGKPQKNFHAMVFGKPKQGKSIFCVQFAKYLAENFGRVLYIASEEGFSATLQNKIRNFGMANENLDFANYRDYEQIKAALERKPYSFVVIDSVNFIKIEPEQVEELKAANPNTAFITIQQATKDGKFRGSQEFAHNCDSVIEVISGVAHQIGRFQEPSEMAIFEDAETKEKAPSDTTGPSEQLDMFEEDFTY